MIRTEGEVLFVQGASGVTEQVRLSSVLELERLRGRDLGPLWRNPRNGVLLGAAAGALFALLGTCSFADYDVGCERPRAVIVKNSAALFSGIGLGLGIVFGARESRQRWEYIKLPAR